MWTPFESKFENIVSRIEHHRNAIEDELQILTLRKFVDLQNSLFHQAQTTTEIRDDLHGQTCSTDELRQAMHTLNEATTAQSQTLAKQLTEYRQLLETQHSCPGGLRLVLAIPIPKLNLVLGEEEPLRLPRGDRMVLESTVA